MRHSSSPPPPPICVARIPRQPPPAVAPCASRCRCRCRRRSPTGPSAAATRRSCRSVQSSLRRRSVLAGTGLRRSLRLRAAAPSARCAPSSAAVTVADRRVPPVGSAAHSVKCDTSGHSDTRARKCSRERVRKQQTDISERATQHKPNTLAEFGLRCGAVRCVFL